MFECVWEVLQSFSRNDKKLAGDPGMMAMLHMHSRKLDFHPHIHVIMSAIAVDKLNERVQSKHTKYRFNHKVLVKVFRGKLLAKLIQEKLTLPKNIPLKWAVNCKHLGAGGKVLVYLGRYLYRGVIHEKDILSVSEGECELSLSGQ